MNADSDLAGYGSESGVEQPRRAILEYLEVPLRRRWYVLIPFAVITAASVGWSFVLPTKYSSSTLILVESEKVPESFVPRTGAGNPGDRLYTIKEEILSRTRLERVIEELNPYPEMMGKAPLTSILDTMRAAIEIQVKGRDAFKLGYSHTDPHKARDVANRLATLFIDEVSQERQQMVAEARDFIESQLEGARRQLESKEDAVRRYKQSQMGSLPEQLAANLATLQRLQLDHQGVNQNLRAAQERQDSLEKSLTDQLRGVVAVGATSSDPLVELKRLRNRLAELHTRYTDEHPDVRVVLAQIAQLEKELGSPSTQESGGVDPAELTLRAQIEASTRETRGLEARQKELEGQIAAFQIRVERTPQVEQELTTLTRDYQKLNENYLTLLSKKLDAEMAEKLERRWKGERFRILDPAHLPERPYSPNHLWFLLGGMAVGLLVGLTLSVAAEALDHSVKSVAELEAVLPYPILARLPYLDVKRGPATASPRRS